MISIYAALFLKFDKIKNLCYNKYINKESEKIKWEDTTQKIMEHNHK